MTNEVRLAWRYLLHHKWTSAAAMVPLALSIGLSTGVFNIANSTVLRQLAVPASDQLVIAAQVQSAGSGSARFSLSALKSMRRASQGMAEVTGYSTSETLLGDRFTDRRVNVALVARDYFSVLRASPALGTLFNEAEETWGASPLAVLSYTFWQREFAGRPEAIGSDIVLNGRKFIVVGIASSTFSGLQPTLHHDLYVPLNMKPATSPGFQIPQENMAWLYVFARVPDTQNRQALAGSWTAAFNELNATMNLSRGSRIVLRGAGSGNPFEERDIRDLVAALSCGGGLILLVALFSAAGVVLAMEVEERRGMGTMLVLGATFKHVVRIWVIRMLVLALPIGLAAHTISVLAANLIIAQYSVAHPELVKADMAVGPDALALSLGMATLVSVLLSSLLWFESRRLDPIALVHDSSQGTGSRCSKLQSMQTVGQIALAVALFVAGGIAMRYWSAIENRDLGYRPAGLASVHILMDFRSVGGGPGSSDLILQRAFDSLSALPIIRGVSASKFPLLVPAGAMFTIYPEQSTLLDTDMRDLACHWVGPSWFKTIGAQMVAGREFGKKDGYAAPGVAVVSESFARRVWPGVSALGRRIKCEPFHRDVEVIGVARDFQGLPSLEFRAQPGLYLCLLQMEEPSPTLVLRVEGNAGAALAEVKTTLRGEVSDVKVLEVNLLEQQLDRLLWKQRFYGFLVRVLVALALALAVFGVYANVRRFFVLRKRELAIRMAIGASQAEMTKIVLRTSFGLVGTGTLVGALLATVGAKIVQGTMPSPFPGARLIVLQPLDPVVHLGAAAVFLALGCLAAAAAVRENRTIDLAAVMKSE